MDNNNDELASLYGQPLNQQQQSNQTPQPVQAQQAAQPSSQQDDLSSLYGQSLPVGQNTPVAADLSSQQLNQKPNAPLSDMERLGLSLKRTGLEGKQLAQQELSGDIGVMGMIGNSIVHPINQIVADYDLLSGNVDKSGNAIPNTAHDVQGINQQLHAQDKPFITDKGQWIKEAVENNVLDAAGLAVGSGLTNFAKKGITALMKGSGTTAAEAAATDAAAIAGPGLWNSAKSAATGLMNNIVKPIVGGAAGNYVGGVVGEKLNKGLVDDPKNPEYFSRENQAKLANQSLWAGAGAVAGSAIPNPNKLPGKTVDAYKSIQGMLDGVLNSKDAQVNQQLKTANALNVDLKDLPKNVNAFTPDHVADLHNRIQAHLTNITGVNDNVITDRALHPDKYPAPLAEFADATNNDSLGAKKSNSFVTDGAVRALQNSQYKSLQPMWALLDKHGFTETDQSKISEAVKDQINQLQDKGIVGNLFGNGALSMNYITPALEGHAADIASKGPAIIDSMLQSLRTVAERSNDIPGITAESIYKKLNPIVTEAKDNSIKYHLTQQHGLSENEAQTLTSKIKGAYSGKDQIGQEGYGNELPSGYAENREFYDKNFGPDKKLGNYSYADYHEKIAANNDKLTDWGNQTTNNTTHILDVMNTPEYKKAFGSHNFGKDDASISLDEHKDNLLKNLTYSSDRLGVSLGDGIKSGVVPKSLNKADSDGFARVLDQGNNTQNSFATWLTKNADVAPLLFKHTKNGLIERSLSYPETLSGLLSEGSGAAPVATKNKVMQLMQNKVPGLEQFIPQDEYGALKDTATGHVMNQAFNLIKGGKAEDFAKLQGLADQYHGIFGSGPDGVDGIVHNSLTKLGLQGLKEGQSYRDGLADTVKNLVGIENPKAIDFNKQIQDVHNELLQRMMPKKGLGAHVLSTAAYATIHPLRAAKIAVDVLARMSPQERIAIAKGKKVDGLNKIIGESLKSRSNYDAALHKANIEKSKVYIQRAQNVFTGGAVNAMQNQ